MHIKTISNLQIFYRYYRFMDWFVCILISAVICCNFYWIVLIKSLIIPLESGINWFSMLSKAPTIRFNDTFFVTHTEMNKPNFGLIWPRLFLKLNWIAAAAAAAEFYLGNSVSFLMCLLTSNPSCVKSSDRFSMSASHPSRRSSLRKDLPIRARKKSDVVIYRNLWQSVNLMSAF